MKRTIMGMFFGNLLRGKEENAEKIMKNAIAQDLQMLDNLIYEGILPKNSIDKFDD